MPLLKPGDHFPPITITPVDGEPIDLPDALAGHFAVILFNRGSWCPYCNAQLRAFQRDAEKLDSLDIKVVSLSVDDEATARELIAKHGLTSPVGHSADATAIGGRYMRLDRAEEFGRRNAEPGELLVRLRPQRVIATADVAG